MSGNIYSLPQLEPPRPDDITVALKLVMALGDTKGTAATLKRLAEATAAHMAAAGEAEEKLAELDRKSAVLDQRFSSADSAIAAKHAEADRHIADKERAADERLRQREVTLANREKAVAEADKKYLELSSDLERRLQMVRAAGAA